MKELPKLPLVIVLSVLTAFLSACAVPLAVNANKLAEPQETVRQREWLVGQWSGEVPVKTGGKRVWTVRRFSDGTYRTDFQSIGVNDVPELQSEIGIWGVSGGVYFTATRGFVSSTGTVPAGTNDASLYDVYRVIHLSSDVFEYEHLSTGERYQTKLISR